MTLPLPGPGILDPIWTQQLTDLLFTIEASLASSSDDTGIGEWVGYDAPVVDSSSSSSRQVIGTITANVLAGRDYFLRVEPGVNSSLTNGIMEVSIRLDSANGTELQASREAAASVSGNSMDMSLVAWYTPTVDESRTFVVAIAPIGGGSTLREAGPGGYPSLFTIELVD